MADAPAWKPAGSACEYALNRVWVTAAETMLVAVHPWDIQGAYAAGLATGFVNRTGTPYPAFFPAPGVEASSLVELAAALVEGVGRQPSASR